jgi:hypothetical protein
MTGGKPAAILTAERRHLAELLEAIERCVYFLEAADRTLVWPLDGALLDQRKKDTGLFSALSAINERFAKLQDTLGAAMRHALGLSGESADSFLRVLAIYEKAGVIESVESWQLCRTARNLAAHDYDTRYREVAAHFNGLHELRPTLYAAAKRFVAYCERALSVTPASPDFSPEFAQITAAL